MIGVGMGGSNRSMPDEFQSAFEAFTSPFGGCDVIATYAGAACMKSVECAALRLGVRFIALPLEALLARNGDCLTRSDRSVARLGLASVAEAAALAAAGDGSILIDARRIVGSVTIAAARSRLRVADV